ncbi:hypothetical protein ANCCAN_10667 [Ancylostoma caninum]|uniref:PDZ domain-containing protein n=1 Tax=Ancylostoma caninum TaxID=29170 RepID=A0A368GG49_ANCCA|nr:hypothetical protein ANCCAN_10667 [Ancylostoma caninum]
MFILTNVLTMSRTGSSDDDHSCEDTQLLTDKLQESSDELVKTSDAQDIPPDRGKNITRKKGWARRKCPGSRQGPRSPQMNFMFRFAYSLVTINYVKGARFGLGIKHHKDQVLVSKSKKGSLCDDRLKRLDRIIDVNGSQVADRDVCEEMLIKSLQKTKKVSLLIERPINKDAVASMEAFLADAGRKSTMLSPARHTGQHSAPSSLVRDVNIPKAKKSQSSSLLKKQRSNSLILLKKQRSNSLISIITSGSSRKASKESINADRSRGSHKISQRESSDRNTKALKTKKSSKLLAVGDLRIICDIGDLRIICDSLSPGYVTVFQIVSLRRKPELRESKSINKI